MDNIAFNDGERVKPPVRVICTSPVMREMICRLLSRRFTVTDSDATFTVVCTDGEVPQFRGPGIIIEGGGKDSEAIFRKAKTANGGTDEEPACGASGGDVAAYKPNERISKEPACGASGGDGKGSRSPDANRIYLPRPLDIAKFCAACESLSEKAVRRTPAGYVADSSRCVVSLGDASVSLTKTEFALFSVLSERCGEPVGRGEIEERLWGNNIRGNVCGVYVSYLRKKLSAIAGDGAVTSVRGRGYMLNIPVNKNEG